MDIKKLSDLAVELAKRVPKILVVVNAVDEHTLEAVNTAVDSGIVRAVLTGDPVKIDKICSSRGMDMAKFRIEPAYSEEEASLKGIEIVLKGEADILMKGLLSTDKYMRAILNKEHGLVPPKGVLTHVTVVENPCYHKLLVVGDVAIIPYPDLSQKIVILGYLIHTAHMLGIENPKVAVVAATEQVLPAIPACTDAAILAKMADRGQFKNAIVDGPLSFDVAVDKESAEIKNVHSPVAGDADCLLFPNIDAGNLFYKMSTRMCRSEQAAIVAGARVPVVLTSRGDTMLTKLYSIALAVLLS